MATYIHHLATLVPPTAYNQPFARDVMKTWLGGDRRLDRILDRIYARSGIEKRHSVVGDFQPDAPLGIFADSDGGSYQAPGTQARNDLYTREASEMYAVLAREALRDCPGFEAEEITHVITVSCTGFFAPGPDYVVTRALGLSPNTERYHLGFMGCCAAFPALRMARAFCQSRPDAVVLILCLELCTLHLDPTPDLDNLIASAVFADGAAAAVVSQRPPQADARALELLDFNTTLVPEGANDMTWVLGDSGFRMTLSTRVPGLVETHATGAVEPLLEAAGLSRGEIACWAVHPGGRAILDVVEKVFGLRCEQLAASRWVLRHHGNMSSATVLFVLKRILDTLPRRRERNYLAGMAFGPGLTMESGLLATV